MKNQISLFLTLLLCFALASCGAKQPEQIADDFDLAELSNPFIGKWQSDIPSAGMTLIFDYKADGTFDYEMVGVPAEEGGVGSGGYVVYDNIQVTWLDFEGAAAYTFEVADNDTINVTELEPNDSGELVPGNTAPFTRVEGSEVNKKDTLFSLNNPLIGKFGATIPDEGTWTFEFRTDGSSEFVLADVLAEQGVAPGCYVVFGDKLAVYMTFGGANYLKAYSFAVADTDTLTVSELAPNETGELVPGNTLPFIRVAE
ncbi:MAG: hypothetical protein LBN43_04780 [Oscillospiraceae bacterium]|jgi:hypothetical protein|nr:hypothetical protein [Oscillospiraceae bacterium]